VAEWIAVVGRFYPGITYLNVWQLPVDGWLIYVAATRRHLAAREEAVDG